MKFVSSQRMVSLLLSVTTLVALYVAFRPVPGNSWVLDSLTGIVAAATAVAICARLALVTPSKLAHQYWRVVLLLLAIVSISQFVEPILNQIEKKFGLDGASGYLALAAALAVLWLIARLDPLPVASRRVLWGAFCLQVAGTIIGQWGDGQGAGDDLAPWLVVADFFRLMAMQVYLLGAVLFVSYLRRQMFVTSRRPSDVGDVARYLFVTSRLFQQHRYPRIRNFAAPGGHLGLGIARFFAWFIPMGRRVRDRFRRSLWQQFRDICVLGFRHGLDAQAYYMFEFYRAVPRSRASGYLTRYETKNGLFKVLNWQVPKIGRRTPLGDKLIMEQLCTRHGVPCVPNLVVAEGGRIQFKIDQPAALERDLFLKPRQLKGARGTELIRFSGNAFIREDGEVLSHDGLMQHVARRSQEAPILVQPRIVNHPGLADLAEQSLLPIRVLTCLDADGNPVITHGMLRVLCKLEPSWPTDIELGAPVDLETGILGEMTGDKPEMAFEWYADHPITKAGIVGRQVPHWDEVRSIALAAHAICKDRLLIGWDIAIGPTGAVLLEGNSYPDVDFPQRVHRCAIGDSPLGPLLFARVVDLERRIANDTLLRDRDFPKTDN
ncbi:sugar-transfer associated ATP-grasp domain-containing protein [Dongia sp.]|uniref:sugar-transfer associated ATP-grasp domain-containing protein n=1 Tax=Dongia sp. TaxID=1977262 RepID=UPI0035B1D2F3